MSTAALAKEWMTFDEYLDFEETTEVRHEFVSGFVYAMGGASDWHNIVSLNLASACNMHLRGNPCRAFNNDMKLRVQTEEAEEGYYPDVMVCCDPADTARLYRTSPVFIAEVASPSTERIDRIEKFDAYRGIEALSEYALIQSASPRIEIFRRRTDWEREVYRPYATFELESIGLSLSVLDLYDGVDYLANLPSGDPK
jgi:Uma2 family endonuclease